MRSARPFLCFLALMLVLMVPTSAHAQQWSGIIAPSRATDWSGAGATIVIRTTQCGSTVNPYSGDASTINNAIAACPSGQFVQLGAGTFTLSSGILFTKSGVTLRGMGADQTKLFINGTVNSCGLGGGAAIYFCDGKNNCPSVSAGCGAIDNTATWTAAGGPPYAVGTTVLTFSSTAGLVAGPPGTGSTVYLDQLDDASDGYPATGDIYACASSSNNCTNQGGTGLFRRDGPRSHVQVVTITAINGSNVTISPGLQAPDWRASQSPGAYWNNSYISGSSIENLSVDYTGVGAANFIQIKGATNCWITGVRDITLYNNSSGSNGHYASLMTSHLTVRSNYSYGGLSNGLDRYFINDATDSSNLYENNICHHQPSCIIPNGPGSGNVYAYNYIDDGFFSPAGTQPHDGARYMDLFEGNNWASVLGDVTHATHFFETFFRNHHDGFAHNPSTTIDTAYTILSNNRFYNAVGNVIGHSHYVNYETDLTSDNNAIWDFGWQGNNSGSPVTTDTNVKRTVMRWANWDSVTSTNKTGTNDQTGVRFVSAEVPGGLTKFPNPVPVSQTLPASFYLSSKPSWFGSVPFPPIGPDVSNGNAPNTATVPTGGHANKIPARVCFENTPSDPAYSTSPPIKLFNATRCYSSSQTPPAPPTSLSLVVN